MNNDATLIETIRRLSDNIAVAAQFLKGEGEKGEAAVGLSPTDAWQLGERLHRYSLGLARAVDQLSASLRRQS